MNNLNEIRGGEQMATQTASTGAAGVWIQPLPAPEIGFERTCVRCLQCGRTAMTTYEYNQLAALLRLLVCVQISCSFPLARTHITGPH